MFENKGSLGAIALLLVAAGLKNRMGGQRNMSFSHIVATDLLEKAGNNSEMAKRMCREQYGEGSDMTNQICAAIDMYAPRGSAYKIPQPASGFSREQDVAFFDYLVNRPTHPQAPDVSELRNERKELLNQKINKRGLKAQKQNKINELAREISDKEMEINTIQAEWDTLKIQRDTDTTLTSGQKGALTRKLNQLDRDMQSIRAEVSALQGEEASIRAQANDLETRINEIGRQLLSTRAEIDEARRLERIAGKPLSLEQYAEAEYQRGFTPQFETRYGDGGPAQKAWNEFNGFGAIEDDQEWNPSAKPTSLTAAFMPALPKF